MKKNNGFTLMELLVTISLAMIILGIILGGNYFFQIKKGQDSKRKQDFHVLQRILEDYYADKGVYPPVGEIAYATMADTPNAGKVCGSTYTGATLLPYSKQLPCNPTSPLNDYVYFSANNGQDYALFTVLVNDVDVDIVNSGCEHGCSYYTDPQFPSDSVSDIYFNYVVSSTGLTILDCQPIKYIGCYPHTTISCRGCPNGQCGGYTRLYCKAQWCQDYCNL